MPSLEQLGYSSYDEYLQSSHWKGIRRKYQSSGLFQHCLVCDNPRYQLHHLNYGRLGCERLSDLVPLCSPHHQIVEEYINRFSGKEKYRIRGSMDVVLCECFGMSKERSKELLRPFKKLKKKEKKSKKKVVAQQESKPSSSSKRERKLAKRQENRRSNKEIAYKTRVDVITLSIPARWRHRYCLQFLDGDKIIGHWYLLGGHLIVGEIACIPNRIGRYKAREFHVKDVWSILQNSINQS